jgi:hypothetical protein
VYARGSGTEEYLRLKHNGAFLCDCATNLTPHMLPNQPMPFPSSGWYGMATVASPSRCSTTEAQSADSAQLIRVPRRRKSWASAVSNLDISRYLGCDMPQASTKDLELRFETPTPITSATGIRRNAETVSDLRTSRKSPFPGNSLSTPCRHVQPRDQAPMPTMKAASAPGSHSALSTCCATTRPQPDRGAQRKP